MAEAPGASNVGGYKSGASCPGPEATRSQEDLRETMEASDSLFSQYEKTLDINFLNRAIALAETAITKTDPLHLNRAVLSAKLGKMQGNKFEHTEDEGDLDMAWVWAIEGMDKTPQNIIDCATACSSILTIRCELESTYGGYRFPGGDSYRRYKRLGNLNDLNEAFIEVEKAIDAYPPGSHTRPIMLHGRSLLLSERFKKLGDVNDQELAAGTYEEIVRLSRSGDLEHTTALAALGTILSERFERTGDLGDLQKAIEHGEEVLIATPQDDPSRAAAQKALGARLATRFKLIGDLGDLQKSIKHTEEALSTTPQDHPDRAGRQSNLGSMLSRRFQRIGDLGDLQKAIEHTEDAFAATSQDHTDRASGHNNMGSLLSLRFERLGDLRDLQKAIKHGQEALATSSPDHRLRAAIHNNLGCWLSWRFQRIGDLGDLQKSITHAEEAIAATPQDHPDRAGRHNNLGFMLSSRFERIGDLGDLEKAIEHAEEALAATPQDHLDRAGRHNNLGSMLSSRFVRIGDLGDLQRAIGHTEEALAAIPQDHLDRARGHNNLGFMLSSRFERIGDLGDLQKAIEHAEEALAATPQDHPLRATIHDNLGSRLSSRFERRGDLGDLQKAIKHGEEALATTPRDHPFRGAIHNNLGAWLTIRFQRIGDLGDLQESITHAEEALAAAPQDHPSRSHRQNNLGCLFFSKFRRIGDLEDLRKAIEHTQEALTATPQDHPNRASRHHHLGYLLSERFERIGDMEDIQTAIQHGEEALAATPQDHPHRAGICTTLGGLLESRFDPPYRENGTTRSLRLYIEAYDCRTSPPRVRVMAAHRAASLLYSTGKFRESISILEDAVNLIPTVDLRYLKRDDQQHILSELSGLASIAASVALQAGREPYDSLKMLELGRGIIMGFSIDSRSDVSDLKTDHPLTFDRFHRLRVEIDSPMDGMNSASDEAPDQSQNRAISRRWEAVNEMEETLRYIRGLPGYAGFLLPPSQYALMKMATNGPMVVFNCTPYRSDAIIVTTSAIASLELPKLNCEDTGHRMSQLASFGGGSPIKRGQDTKQMKELLLWLWDVAVGPVFDHLECRGIPTSEGVHDTNLKRIWWIGVGQLSMAPFHAAGDHTRGSTRNTLSRAISTYIPTIKALAYARQSPLQLFDECGASFSPERSKKAKILTKRNPRLLLVPMPKTPGAIDLPGVCKEIQHTLDSGDRYSIDTTVLMHPTPAEVLEKVKHHDIVHFACHGVSCINPSDSHLILFSQDGVNADKLLARDISNVVAHNAQIAYLSACSSAKNPSANLADEVIHLASAFQLSGFSHTFANMWETDDNAACEVARDFYNFLLQDQGNCEDDHRRVSTAFHKAVKKVRDAKPGNPLLWAPFIHTGA